MAIKDKLLLGRYYKVWLKDAEPQPQLSFRPNTLQHCWWIGKRKYSTPNVAVVVVVLKRQVEKWMRYLQTLYCFGLSSVREIYILSTKPPANSHPL